MKLSMMAVSTRIEGYAKVSGPEWFVHSREVDIHPGEMFDGVVTWLKSMVSHLG